LKAAMRATGRLQCVGEVSDGAEAIAYLNGDGDFNNRRKFPLPHLLLLDLKMPVFDGFDVLSWLKNQPGLQRVPAIVFSSSGEPEDVKKAQGLGAADFQVKPNDFSELVRVVQKLSARWLSSAPGAA